MHGASGFVGLFLACAVAACAGAEQEVQTASRPALAAFESAYLSDIADAVKPASCPDSRNYVRAERFAIDVAEISVGTKEKLDAALTGVRLSGAWHLESHEPNFGGLSGLAVLPSGSLLAVSDAGAFISIELQDGVPDGYGSISYMRAADGTLLDGKQESDSEGLLLFGGTAFVSFERDHRVLAFDLEGCGSVARGIEVARFSRNPAGLGRPIPENGGLEALTNLGETLIGGLETLDGGGAPIASISSNTVSFPRRLPNPAGLRLTGMDTFGSNVFSVFRSYSPMGGNRIEVRRFVGGLDAEPETLLRLSRPLTVDNFEGIAATQLPDGTIRLFLVSDDNFSHRQRTLLMTFDLWTD